jgi:putative phosphoesterase
MEIYFMKIGIISDSHDHHANVLNAVEIFKNEQVQYILHAGDIVSPFTAKAFSAVSGARFIAVFGNNDGEKALLKSTIESFCRKASPSGGGEIHRDLYHGQIAGKKILMTHKPSPLDEAIASGKYDLIVYGHTHFKDIKTSGKTLIINPGEATDWLSGKGSLVILGMDNLEIREMNL